MGKSLGRSLGLSSRDRLRVLLYHDVAPELQARFEAQLRWLKKSWTFVSPERFAAMASGDEPIRGSNVLLTFDDGFASNRVVAEKILGPLEIQALFFVVSDFIDIADPAEARQFIVANIFPHTPAADVPQHLRNMQWTDLAALIQQGHTIGAHTRTHARLSELATDAALEDEIIASADTLEQHLGTGVDHFAYTFGDQRSFTDRTLAVAKRRFPFIYTGMRGDNAGGVSPLALRRDAVTAADSPSLVGAFVEGMADFHYPPPLRESTAAAHEA